MVCLRKNVRKHGEGYYWTPFRHPGEGYSWGMSLGDFPMFRRGVSDMFPEEWIGNLRDIFPTTRRGMFPDTLPEMRRGMVPGTSPDIRQRHVSGHISENTEKGLSRHISDRTEKTVLGIFPTFRREVLLRYFWKHGECYLRTHCRHIGEACCRIHVRKSGRKERLPRVTPVSPATVQSMEQAVCGQFPKTRREISPDPSLKYGEARHLPETRKEISPDTFRHCGERSFQKRLCKYGEKPVQTHFQTWKDISPETFQKHGIWSDLPEKSPESGDISLDSFLKYGKICLWIHLRNSESDLSMGISKMCEVSGGKEISPEQCSPKHGHP
jgi:hypothetical protein